MSLPYSYKSKVEIPESEEFDVVHASDLCEDYLRNKGLEKFRKEKGIIHFISDHSLVNFKYPVEIKVEKNELIVVEYEIHLMQLIKITIVLIVFIAFFSSFGMSGFLWFSFIFSVVFFVVNLMFADSSVQKLIKSSNLYLSLKPSDSEGFTDEQKTWINDKNRCSACGEEINVYDVNCPDCGLKLQQSKYTIPLDVTKYQAKRFKYHYKQKPEGGTK